MRIQKAWLSTIPVLLLSAACGEARTPTGPQAVRLEVLGSLTDPTRCQSEFVALDASTQVVTITSKDVDKDRGGLLKIIADASDLADSGKDVDAVKKLTDFIVKVEQLEAAGRLDAASADQLVHDANAAIACINSTGA